MNIKIGISAGDPAGIGPEIIVKMIAGLSYRMRKNIIVYGAPDILLSASKKFANLVSFEIQPTANLPFKKLVPGKISSLYGKIAYDSILMATKDALAGKIDALVTAPVCKASINKSGIAFTGHTETIAEMCGTANFAMMQSAGNLRIVFATTHIPLFAVTQHISRERVIEVTKLLHDCIREEGIKRPHIAVAALNPHAGENGYMGSEEKNIIEPAIKELKSGGMNLEGPFPPDTLFIPGILGRYDGIVSMYHDQGHIPFKMLAFNKGVNSTLGIPIIRTSVDHGTAFDIAWKGLADAGSLLAALNIACKRAKSRKKERNP